MDEQNCVMAYDAYMLFADQDDDEKAFAKEIKEVLEKRYYFKVCTREDFLIGTLFEHDAIASPKALR
jgi:hypothetical protein